MSTSTLEAVESNEKAARFQTTLAARIEGLEAAKRALEEGDSEAKESIRRIAHSLRIEQSFPEIVTAASAVEEANGEALPERFLRLLAALRRAVLSVEVTTGGILIVDDDSAIYYLLQPALSTVHPEILVAGSAEQAEKILSEKKVSLILLDLILPDMDGRNLLLRLREDSETAAIPVIVLTSKTNPVTRAECFALGAETYFEKPFDPMAVSAAAASTLSRRMAMALESDLDPLTGLANQKAFSKAFDQTAAVSLLTKVPFCLALLDLDYFKVINQSYGHSVGDEVLRRVGLVLQKSLRKWDILARWADDEFVVLLRDTDLEDAVSALQKAGEALTAETFQKADGRTFGVTFSAGVVPVSKGASLEEGVLEAKRFVSLAKDVGGNRVCGAEKLSGPKRILLADDDEVMATVVKYRLEHDGFDVVHFSNGMEALSAALQGPVSLVILDVRMPEMDGFEVLENLRKTPALAELPVIVVTALGNEKNVIRAFELGADDYIVKPFSIAELSLRIRRLLARSEAAVAV